MVLREKDLSVIFVRFLCKKFFFKKLLIPVDGLFSFILI